MGRFATCTSQIFSRLPNLCRDQKPSRCLNTIYTFYMAKTDRDTPHGLGTRGRRIDGLRGIRRKVLLDANAPAAVSRAYELGILRA